MHQRRQPPRLALCRLARSSAPQHARLFVRREVRRLKGHAVRAQDGLEARGRRDNVHVAGRQGRVDVQGRVGAVVLGAGLGLSGRRLGGGGGGWGC